MNIHNLLYLIPNTRKERAKSLPRNWPRVNYLHIVLVVFVVVVLFVAVVVVVVVFVVDVAVFFVWQFQQIKIICTYLASLSLFPLLF